MGTFYLLVKSKARLFKKGKAKNTFDDVAGSEEAKKEVMENCGFLETSR